jgi:hypothetical protein
MHNRAIKSLWPRPGCIRTKVEAHMGEFRRAKRTMSLRPRAKCKEKARIFRAFLLSSNGSSGVRDSSLDRSIHNPGVGGARCVVTEAVPITVSPVGSSRERTRPGHRRRCHIEQARYPIWMIRHRVASSTSQVRTEKRVNACNRTAANSIKIP